MLFKYDCIQCDCMFYFDSDDVIILAPEEAPQIISTQCPFCGYCAEVNILSAECVGG